MEYDDDLQPDCHCVKNYAADKYPDITPATAESTMMKIGWSFLNAKTTAAAKGKQPDFHKGQKQADGFRYSFHFFLLRLY